ncbi:HTH-type transcriptional regulator MhqR [Methylacidimicrobium cyclopophantes]|uniref:HTH-type transcriptional regulator MhqR n=1 Tax=Methylacidimicrobium cyclopophantes TaxID=1041766 RepID=A0A5E6M9A4_9BACT|nr:MarR family transcriptional regulator [Methylacidimicrobium cyclopophantes]VVM06142.1 HTH-type transcriptional regulator MhqR [Methylacidimicrobium cyclopophantes]
MPTHHKGPAPEVRALDAFIKLMRASETLLAALRGPLGRVGLTPGQFGVLETLFHLGPLTERELGRKLLRSGGNTTVVVDNLERRSLVYRARSPSDRRCVTVSLTPKGLRWIRRIFPLHAARITEAMGALRPEEQEELGRLCRKLGHALQEGRSPQTAASHR